MATALNEDNVALTGRSGETYTLAVWRRETRFQPRGGVYIMARGEGWPKFTIVFVGETGDMSKRPFVKDREPCFKQHGADYIFSLDEQDAKRRKAIADDLIQAISPVCNRM